MWVVEYMEPKYKSNPLSYVSSLIGHEGENSLFSLLKDEGLALELTSWDWSMMNLFTFFFVTVTLTKKGLEEYTRVINYVAAYLEMLR